MKVVIDTPVLLQALTAPAGEAGALRQAWQQGLITPLVSTATITELMQALAWPAWQLNTEARDELLADLLPYAEVVQPLARSRKVGAGRQALLALMAGAQAQALITRCAAWPARIGTSRLTTLAPQSLLDQLGPV